MTCKYRFSFMPGYFADYAEIGKHAPESEVTTQPNLGLLERPYDTDTPETENMTQWERLTHHIDNLNRNSAPGESYKLLYLIRHGLGFHNVFIKKVGTQAWDEYWSHLDGDGEVTWFDAKLIEDGKSQARALSRFWTEASKGFHMPLPQSLYTSPLARCLETTKLVYSDILSEHGRKLMPTVKELLRERLTDHTCDKRNTRSWIEENYPAYVIEKGFSEPDLLWKATVFESSEHHMARKQTVFEDIFEHDESTVISLTAHSYAMSAILEVVGAPSFYVAEGTMFPLLVKAVKI